MKFNSKFLLPVVLLLAVGAAIAFPQIKSLLKPPSGEIKKKFAKNLCLLTHDYVYEVSITKEDLVSSLYLVKDENNQFDNWEYGNTGNRLYASALVTDSTGICITSKYAAMPWTNAADVKAIKEMFAKELDFDPANITVSGLSIRMTVKPVAETAGGNADGITYQNYTDEVNKEFDIAFLGPGKTNGALPFAKVPYYEYWYGEENPAGIKLYLLGVPKQDFLNGLTLSAEVSQLKTEKHGYHGMTMINTGQWYSEGAPVFNNKGKLVGVYTSVNKENERYFVSNFVRPKNEINAYIPQLPEVIFDTVVQKGLEEVNRDR